MTPATDPFMAGVPAKGIQRGRGGFYRSADDAPYVSDPSGEVCKTGERKGEVKRLKYGSPSGVGRLIENDVGLTKYKQRNTLLGIGMDDGLREACMALVDLAPDTDEFRKAADSIVVAADNLTRSWLAADRGTHGHLLTEIWDRGDGRIVLPNTVVVEGINVGLDKPTQIATVSAWSKMLHDNGLEVLAIEAPCVDDRWHLAGTLDRIVRCTRELRFAMPSGEVVVIPAGTVLILDIKFGAVRRAHLIQVASYDQSVPYDTETEVRGEWPWGLSHEHALIAHGSFDPPSISLVWVDLAAGREHGGETVARAKAWSARDDLWSVAQLDLPVDGIGDLQPSTGTDLAEGEFPIPPPTAIAGEGEADSSSGPSPALLVMQDLADRGDATAQLFYGATPDPARLAVVQARDQLTATPDQGRDLSEGFDELWAAMKAQFEALDPAARSWRGELVSEAQRRHVPFHAQQVRTERTYQINKGIIALCAGGYVGASENELLRALLALVIGDVALFPGVHPGHALGSLGAAEAARFADLVDTFNGPGLAAWIDHDQIFRLRELSPA